MRLAQAKAKVTLLERGEIGAEASSAAAGMLAPQGEMISPPAFSDLCLKSRDLYPAFVAEVEELSGEKVGYRTDGAVLVGISDAECHALSATHLAQTPRAPPGRGVPPPAPAPAPTPPAAPSPARPPGPPASTATRSWPPSSATCSAAAALPLSECRSCWASLSSASTGSSS